MKLDRVLTVDEFRDAPRRGVAELHGVPHIYEAEFDHSGEGYGDTYFLSPIERGLLALVLQERAIRQRRDLAVARGDAPPECGPSLPEDRPRLEAIRHLVGARVRVDPENCRYYSAKFRPRDPEVAPGGWLVEWRCELRVR